MHAWLRSKHPLRLALILWALYALVVCIIVARDPLTREVTSAYRLGAGAFFASTEMYPRGLHGWLYPPHSAVALWPFALGDGGPILPIELAWRLLGIGALCAATWQLWKRLVAAGPCVSSCHPSRVGAATDPSAPSAAPRAPGPVWRGLTQSALDAAPLFLLMSAVAMITAAGSSRTGQVNSLLGASFVFCALALADRRWWRAAAAIGVAFAIKPQALPLMLVAGVLYPPFAWRAALIALGLVALPWLRPDWPYVWQQHVGWYVKMSEDATPEPGTWADICGLLVPVFKWVGVEVPPRGWTLLRALMAPLTLAACWWLARPPRRSSTPAPPLQEATPPPTSQTRPPPPEGEETARLRGALIVLTLCTTYVMLFNPRTEGNTYAVFGPVAGTVAALALRERRWAMAALCVLACIALMFSRELTLNVTNFWLRPLAAIIICSGAVALALRWRRVSPDAVC